jgi:hypothetical protein
MAFPAKKTSFTTVVLLTYSPTGKIPQVVGKCNTTNPEFPFAVFANTAAFERQFE